MTQPPTQGHELLLALEQRSFTTFKCRVRASERLRARSRSSSVALISFSTATTLASVGLLVDRDMYGQSGDLLLVSCAILSLVASLAVSSLDYAGRANRMETNYKDIQDLSSRAQSAQRRQQTPADALEAHDTLHSEYSALVRGSENHTTSDFHNYSEKWTISRVISEILTLSPYISILVTGWILWEFTAWILSHGK